MSNKQTTAVQWLSNQAYELFEQYSEGKFDRIQLNKFMVDATNQAKAIERKQIETSWMEGKQDKTFGDNVFEDAEKYFTSTFITE